LPQLIETIWLNMKAFSAKFAILLSAFAGVPVHAEQTSPPNRAAVPERGAWGILSSIVGHHWLYQEDRARYYLTFKWELPNQVISYSGIDYDGYPLAAVYEFDPATGRFSGRRVYKGDASESWLDITDNGFIETWQAGNQQALNRLRFVRSNASSFVVISEIFRAGNWSLIRQGRLGKATENTLDALNCMRRTAATEAADSAARIEALRASPSFGKRLSNAIQDGITTGVQDGLRDGIHSRIHGAIAPRAHPRGSSAIEPQLSTDESVDTEVKPTPK
jgi:hypothetical protein